MTRGLRDLAGRMRRAENHPGTRLRLVNLPSGRVATRHTAIIADALEELAGLREHDAYHRMVAANRARDEARDMAGRLTAQRNVERERAERAEHARLEAERERDALKHRHRNQSDSISRMLREGDQYNADARVACARIAELVLEVNSGKVERDCLRNGQDRLRAQIANLKHDRDVTRSRDTAGRLGHVDYALYAACVRDRDTARESLASTTAAGHRMRTERDHWRAHAAPYAAEVDRLAGVLKAHGITPSNPVSYEIGSPGYVRHLERTIADLKVQVLALKHDDHIVADACAQRIANANAPVFGHSYTADLRRTIADCDAEIANLERQRDDLIAGIGALTRGGDA